MHITRAVAQHVDGAELLRERLDRRAVSHVEPPVARALQALQGHLVDVGRGHRRPFAHKGLRYGAADPLARRRDEGPLALQPDHPSLLSCVSDRR